MGQKSSNAGGGGAKVQVQPQPQTTQEVSQQATISNAPQNATNLTDAEADRLRKAQDAAYDPTTQAAVKMYISNTDFDNQGHSLSQTMNYLLDNGVDFDNVDSTELRNINRKYGLNLSMGDIASMQYTDSRISDAAHPLGRDTILTKGAHDDMLRQHFGIQDYSKMTEAQLKKAMVGKAFITTSHNSTSYDTQKNPFLGSGSSVSGGREVVYKMNVGGQTKVVFGAKKQSEIVVRKQTAFQVTNVYFSGKTATPRGGRSKPQLIVEMNTI